MFIECHVLGEKTQNCNTFKTHIGNSFKKLIGVLMKRLF